MKFLSKLKPKSLDYSKLVNTAFDTAVKKTGAVVQSDVAQKIKDQTISSMKTAGAIAKNMSDLNGDGKVDVEDLKIAAEKAGIAWEKIDPDLKTALTVGGVAGVGVNVIPVIGQAMAIPTFVGGTAYAFVKIKLKKI
jgi:hypothetical protein